jgi:AraC-like DNA-binding protein
MRQTSIETFVEDWCGRYVVGRHYLVWCHSATLGGTTFWGRPDVRDVEELARLYHLDPARTQQPFDTISDASRLDDVANEVFMRFLPVMRATFGGYQATWRKHALIVAPGVLGALAAGAFPLGGAAHVWRVFVDAASAFAWLERDDAALAQRKYEQIMADHTSMPPALRNLRTVLGRRFADATLEAVAHELGTSARSLQRELAAAGTTFRREHDEARFRVASELVRHTDVKLEAVASQVGLSSISKLNDIFRRVAQLTPRELRARPELGSLAHATSEAVPLAKK